VSVLDLPCWQFSVTTVYHFPFAPIAVGAGSLVAGSATAWVRTGRECRPRITMLYGKPFVISSAIGDMTGIMTEFESGIIWSAYSPMIGSARAAGVLRAPAR
jgi:cytochrome bd-type quinol oxidase subunit 1